MSSVLQKHGLAYLVEFAVLITGIVGLFVSHQTVWGVVAALSLVLLVQEGVDA